MIKRLIKVFLVGIAGGFVSVGVGVMTYDDAGKYGPLDLLLALPTLFIRHFLGGDNLPPGNFLESKTFDGIVNFVVGFLIFAFFGTLWQLLDFALRRQKK